MQEPAARPILTRRHRVRHLHFFDDTFSLDRAYTAELCEAMIRERIPAQSWCCTRVDCVDQEILRLMRLAGFAAVSYGIETGCPRLLELLQKKTTLEQAGEAVRLTKQAGIFTESYFLINLPTETFAESQQTVALALQLDLPYFTLLFATPYPGTRMLEICQEKNLLPAPSVHSSYDNYWCHSDLVIQNPGNPHPQLRRLQKTANLRAFFRPRSLGAMLKYFALGSQIRPRDFYQAAQAALFLLSKDKQKYEVG